MRSRAVIWSAALASFALTCPLASPRPLQAAPRTVGKDALQRVAAAPPPGKAAAARPKLLIESGHAGKITATAWSADGTLAATGSDFGVVHVWDAARGKQLLTIQVTQTRTDATSAGIHVVAFAQGGRTLLTLSEGSEPFKTVLRLWDTRSGEARGELTLPSSPRGLAVAPDGTTLVVGCDDLRLYDLAHRKELGVLPGSEGYGASPSLSADGSRLAAVCTSGGTARVWNLATHTLMCTLERSVSGGDERVALSPDGSVVAWSGYGVELFEVSTKRTRKTPSPFADASTHSLTFTAAGREVVAATDEALVVVATDSGAVLRTLPIPVKATTLSATRDTGRLVVGDELGQGRVYALPLAADAEPLAQLTGHALPVHGVGLGGRNRVLVTTGEDRTLKVWDLRRGRLARSIQLPWDKVVAHTGTPVALSPDGRKAAVGSYDGEVALYSLDTGEALWKVTCEGKRYYTDITALAFAPDGRSIAAGNISGFLTVLEARDGRIRSSEAADAERAYQQAFQHGTSHKQAQEAVERPPITALAYARDSRTLAVGRSDGSVEQLDIGHFRHALIVRRQLDATGHVKGLAFSPDGGHLLAMNEFGELYVWNPESEAPPVLAGNTSLDEKTQAEGAPKTRYAHRRGSFWCTCFAFSPDGRRIALGDSLGQVTVYDSTTNQVRAQTKAHELCINALAYSHDGRLLVTGSLDGSVGFLDPTSGAHLGTALALDQGKDWVVTTPDGQFDGSSGGQRLMEWRIGDATFALEQLFNDFYTPGLLARLAGMSKPDEGEETTPHRDLATVAAPPRLEIIAPLPGERIAGDRATVKVRVTDQGGGLARPGLYLNGHRVPEAARGPMLALGSDTSSGAVQRSLGSPPSSPSASEQPASLVSFQVRLSSGVNLLRATASNRDGSVESRCDEVRVTCEAARRAPELHVVVVGVDRYRSGYQLSFATSDARSIAAFFKPGLFAQVHAHALLDEQATKEAILATLAQVGREAAPEDAVVLYLAGHGLALGEQFYFLPHEARVATNDEVRASSLSSVELGEALTGITATKQVLVIDACHSGASASSLGRLLAHRDSVGQVRAVQRLSKTAGTFLIAASKAEQYASEIPELKHGLLTYCLLTGLGEQGAPLASASGDGTVSVNALLRYLDEMVPRLSEQYQGGERQEVVQASTGQDFPLVVSGVERPASASSSERAHATPQATRPPGASQKAGAATPSRTP